MVVRLIRDTADALKLSSLVYHNTSNNAELINIPKLT